MMLSASTFSPNRKTLLEGVHALLQQKRTAAAFERDRFFRPDVGSVPCYEASLPPYREALRHLLGWPLNEPCGQPCGTASLLAEDALGRIFRVTLKTLGCVESHGLLLLPSKQGRYPLVITQHGGQGSPELAAGLVPPSSANYNQLITGLRTLPLAVYAPQLLVWDKGQEPAFDQNLLDREFRHLGGSRAAMDLHLLQSSLQWLMTHDEVDSGRIGMAGLSYGGFYTLLFAALEPRIRVAVSSCYVNDRFRYNWEDQVWTGSANRFLDREIARMICPRPLFLEAGSQDDIFAPDGFPEVAEQVAKTYGDLGISDRFQSRIHGGGHEYDPDQKAREFLLRWL